VHAPFTGARLSTDLNRWLAALSAARDASANPQLHIGIENRPNNGDGAPAQLLDDLERLRRLAGEWGLGVTFDVAHAASCGADLPDAATQLASQLVNVHISDAGARSYRGGLRNGLFRDHRLPGTGILPLAATLTALRRAGYDGLMTLEASPVAVRAWWPVATRRLLRQAFTDLRALGAGLPATSRTHAEPGYPAR
jgi:sugar phosphate isomerase/epimerase